MEKSDFAILFITLNPNVFLIQELKNDKYIMLAVSNVILYVYREMNY